jgi:hypothetical protein
VLSGVGAWDLSRRESRAPRRTGCKTHTYNQIPLSPRLLTKNSSYKRKDDGCQGTLIEPSVLCTYVCTYVWRRGEAGGPGYDAICNYYEQYTYVVLGPVVINRYVVSGAPASQSIRAIRKWELQLCAENEEKLLSVLYFCSQNNWNVCVLFVSMRLMS